MQVEPAPSPTPAPRPTVDPELWKPHLEATRSAHTHITLYGIRRSGRAVQIELKDVYVELSAERSEAASCEKLGMERPHEHDLRNLTLHEALRRSCRAIVIGDPGSGKTTLLRYVARVVADAWLEPAHAANARKLLGLQDAAPLPLPMFVTLESLDHYLDSLALALRDVRPTHGVMFLLNELWNADIKVDRADLEAALDAGRLLLLLDGLDEIPSHKDRKRAVQAVAKLLQRYGKTRTVLTSRTRAFQEDLRLDLAGLDLYALQRMSRAEIRRFLETWHKALHQNNPTLAMTQADELDREIQTHPTVKLMADNPNILTLIAVLKQVSVKLPERRVDLYAGVVELFLQKDADSGVQEAWYPLLQALDLTEKKRLLMNLAMRMHARGPEQGRTVPVGTVSASFAADLLGSRHCATEDLAVKDAVLWLDWLEQRAGLLVRRDAGVVFAHLSFQEYLVAEALASSDTEELWKVVSGHIQEDWWNEAIRLLLARLEARADKLLRKLIQAGDSKGQVNWTIRGRGVALAVGGLEDIRAMHLPDTVRQEVRGALDKMLEAESGAKAKDRIEAMLALGRVGDPRLGLTRESRWVTIPPGRFEMGTRQGGDDDERPAHPVKIDYSFRMGRFPITNAEYAEFMDAGGYRNRTWWSHGGWSFRERSSLVQPGRWDKAEWNGPNQPVVEVSWWEADAFCRWLTGHLAEKAPTWLEPGSVARLPSEAEWEYVARGRGEGREFPWGKEPPDAERANFDSKSWNPGRSTPVGAYPLGSSRDGLLDMAGNVWEWCEDAWHYGYAGAPKDGSDWVQQLDDFSRVVRGGGWVDVPVRLRAACRPWWLAGYRYGYLGFRVVLVASRWGNLPS